MNPHAHVLIGRMREHEARVIQTRTGERRIPARVSVMELGRDTMRKVQDLTARVVTGESAEDRRRRVARERELARRAGLPARSHINHREYRALMRAAERERQRELVRVGADVAALVGRAQRADARGGTRTATRAGACRCRCRGARGARRARGG